VMMMIAFQCGIHLSSLVTYNVYVYRDWKSDPSIKVPCDKHPARGNSSRYPLSRKLSKPQNWTCLKKEKITAEEQIPRCLLPPSSGRRGSKHLWNVGQFLRDYTTQHPKRQSSSYSLPSSENQVSLGVTTVMWDAWSLFLFNFLCRQQSVCLHGNRDKC
jgi:hypothetical protein